MEAYLTQRGKRDRGDDAEYFGTCRRPSVTLRVRDHMVLLEKLIVDQLIATKDGTVDGNVPENIPDPSLSCRNEVNRRVDERQQEDSTVQQVARP